MCLCLPLLAAPVIAALCGCMKFQVEERWDSGRLLSLLSSQSPDSLFVVGDDALPAKHSTANDDEASAALGIYELYPTPMSNITYAKPPWLLEKAEVIARALMRRGVVTALLSCASLCSCCGRYESIWHNSRWLCTVGL